MSLSDKPAFVQKLVRAFHSCIDMGTLPWTERSMLKYRVEAHESGAAPGPPSWSIKMTLHKNVEIITALTPLLSMFANPIVGWGVEKGFCYLDISGQFEGHDIYFSVNVPLDYKPAVE